MAVFGEVDVSGQRKTAKGDVAALARVDAKVVALAVSKVQAERGAAR